MTRRYLVPLLILIVLTVSVGGMVVYRKYLAGIAPALPIPSKEMADALAAKSLPFFFPPEFELSVFAEGLEAPRVIAFDPAGTMLVSMPAAGMVAALPDEDGNGRVDRIVPVAEGLDRPHGLAFRCETADCLLYVAETDQVTVFAYDQKRLQALNGRKLVDLPGGGRHSTRTLLFLPPPEQDKLLVSVGSSCDTCEEKDWRRAKILLAEGEGRLRTFASGLRNAVFMRINPETREIWATEMGRDFLGDDLPPDEINIIRDGHDYGWPYCYGRNLQDREFDGSAAGPASCRDKTPSHIDIQAHSAPLGLDFFPAEGWPEKYRGNLLVALHGSWNRSTPTGYKVSLFRFAEGGEYIGQEDFISGWLTGDNSSLGRPVDIRILQDGVLYISDDKAGVIYRLALRKNTLSPRPSGAGGEGGNEQ